MVSRIDEFLYRAIYRNKTRHKLLKSAVTHALIGIDAAGRRRNSCQPSYDFEGASVSRIDGDEGFGQEPRVNRPCLRRP